MRRLLFILLLLISSKVNAADVRGSAVFYSGYAADSVWWQFLVDNTDRAATTTDVHINGVLHLDPTYKFVEYNSISDNYVPPQAQTPEHDFLITKAAQLGYGISDAYLHYMNNTVIVLQGDTISIPGWPYGSGTEEQARIPVFYSTLTRRVCNFSTERGRILYKAVVKEYDLNRPTPGGYYHDQIAFDNCGPTLFNSGSILSGGEVYEANGLKAGSAQFRAWWWDGLGQFLVEIKQECENWQSWAVDPRPKYTVINCSNIWTDDYANFKGQGPVAHYFMREFEGNPIRDIDSNYGTTPAVMEFRRRELLLRAAGVGSILSSSTTSTGSSCSRTFPEVQLANLVFYLAVYTDSTFHFIQYSTTPTNNPLWGSQVYGPATPIAKQQLGEPLGEPYLYQMGTDGAGYSYKVFARDFTNGMILIRCRGSWNQSVCPNTEVIVPYGPDMKFVLPDGSFSTGELRLYNGGGTILLDNQQTGVEDQEVANDYVTINYSINSRKALIKLSNPREQHWEGKVYDVQGRLVVTIFEGVLPAGEHSFNYSFNRLSSGVYFLNVKNGENIKQKITVVR